MTEDRGDDIRAYLRSHRPAWLDPTVWTCNYGHCAGKGRNVCGTGAPFSGSVCPHCQHFSECHAEYKAAILQEIFYLRGKIAELQSKPTWPDPIPVGERLPEIDPAGPNADYSVDVLFWSVRWGEWEIGSWDVRNRCFVNNQYGDDDDSATHWLPLPPAPA